MFDLVNSILDFVIGLTGAVILVYLCYVWVQLLVQQLGNRQATTQQFVMKTLLFIGLALITMFLMTNATDWITM